MEFDYIKCGDCLALMSGLADNSIDCIVTSPPYNKKGLSGKTPVGNNIWKKFNIDYDVYEDSMPEKTYQKWQQDFLNECFRVIKPSGSIFYNHKIRRSNNVAHFPQMIFNTKLSLYQMIVWDRKNCCDMRSDYLYPTTELIFWLVKGKPNVYKNQAIYQNEIWEISPSKNSFHPATFPIELAKNCILLSTKEEDVVLDPFIGSGTTAVACVSLSRHYIGFDISEHYVNECNKRLEIGTQLELLF